MYTQGANDDFGLRQQIAAVKLNGRIMIFYDESTPIYYLDRGTVFWLRNGQHIKHERPCLYHHDCKRRDESLKYDAQCLEMLSNAVLIVWYIFLVETEGNEKLGLCDYQNETAVWFSCESPRRYFWMGGPEMNHPFFFGGRAREESSNFFGREGPEGTIQFQSPSPEWQVLSKFSFLYCKWTSRHFFFLGKAYKLKTWNVFLS